MGIVRNYKVLFVLQTKAEHMPLTTAAKCYKVGDIVTLSQLRDFAANTGLIYEKEDAHGGRPCKVYVKDLHGAAHITAESE